MENGRERLVGDPRRVVAAYRQAVAESEGRGHQEAKQQREQAVQAEVQGSIEADDPGDDAQAEGDAEEEVLRWGTREAEVKTARMLAADESERYNFVTGDDVVFEIQVRTSEKLDDFVFGLGIFTFRGVECWGTNTTLAGFESDALDGDVTVWVACPDLRLAPGEYSLDVAVHARDGYAYDYQRRILSFTMTASEQGVGVYFPRHRWSFSGDVKWSRVPRER
jgi:hypothetical protein